MVEEATDRWAEMCNEHDRDLLAELNHQGVWDIEVPYLEMYVTREVAQPAIQAELHQGRGCSGHATPAEPTDKLRLV